MCFDFCFSNFFGGGWIFCVKTFFFAVRTVFMFTAGRIDSASQRAAGDAATHSKKYTNMYVRNFKCYLVRTPVRVGDYNDFFFLSLSISPFPT